MRWNLSERPDALQVLRDYINIKLHFEGSLKWAPGMGQRLTEKTLRERKDSRFFEIVAEKESTRRDVVEKLVTAFYTGPNFWIGDYFHEDLEDDHGKRLKYIHSMRHKFSREFEAICNFMQDRDINLKKLLTNGGNPAIIQHRRSILGGVSDETLALIDYFFEFCEGSESINPLWERRRRMISRYKHFVIPGDDDLDFIENIIASNWLK